MSTLVERTEALAVTVSCTDHELSVVLSDGRTVTVPLAWFPRLVEALPNYLREMPAPMVSNSERGLPGRPCCGVPPWIS